MADILFARVSKVRQVLRTRAGEEYDEETLGYHIGAVHRAGCSYLKDREYGPSGEVVEVTGSLLVLLPLCKRCFSQPPKTNITPEVEISVRCCKKDSGLKELPARSPFLLGPAK
jgi:hypothetical protein